MVLNSYSQTLEGTFLVWNLNILLNFFFLTCKPFGKLSFYFHLPLKEVLSIEVINGLHLHDFLVLLCARFERNHLKFLWCEYISSLDNLYLNYYIYASFDFHRSFKEFWCFGFIYVWTLLANKLDALVAHSCLPLDFLNKNIHSLLLLLIM
ncbi:hypothetical protein M9H77_18612 [Catharanthus roseus]|uniref:Uncharacterized protein n=1 Tax=Catharanthus roseus TaxID=4058 RepID=A0ACC0B7X6_CATRO|nr:hypothetical protein M9H77_18612 [Catharanthus roseus]